MVALRMDQFGGRILNFLYAWRYARRTGRRLYVLWPDSTPYLAGSYEFFDLFDEAAFQAEADEVQIVRTYDFAEVSAATGLAEATLRATWSTYLGFGDQKDRHDDDLPDLVWHRLSSAVTPPGTDVDDDDAASLFARLRLTPQVERTLADFDDLDLADTLAIHLRRGDFIDARVEAHGAVIEEGLFAIRSLENQVEVDRLINAFMAKYLPLETVRRAAINEPRVALYSDVTADRRSLEASFSERLIDVNSRLDAATLTPLQRAFCEWLLMSRSRRILASKSNFSSSAGMLGGAQILRAQKWLRAAEVLEDIDVLLLRSPLSTYDRENLRRQMIAAYQKLFVRLGYTQEAAICETRLQAGGGVNKPEAAWPPPQKA